MWLAHCPLCLWSSDSSERLKNVLTDLDLLKVVWLRIPNSQGNLNHWHRLGWMVVVPCTFVAQRAAQSLHLTSGIVQEIFLDQEKLRRPENYCVAEVVGFQPKKKSFCRQWWNPAHVLSPLLSAALISSLHRKMLQELPSLTPSCNLYPVSFWKSEEYCLLGRYVSISAACYYFSFSSFLLCSCPFFHKYIVYTAIPFLHCLNLHLVFPLTFYSCSSFIFCQTDISFPYFFFASILHPFFHFSVSVTVLPQEDLEKQMRVKVGDKAWYSGCNTRTLAGVKK